MRDATVIDQIMEMYLIDIINKYTGCFVLKFLDIVYFLLDNGRYFLANLDFRTR